MVRDELFSRLNDCADCSLSVFLPFHFRSDVCSFLYGDDGWAGSAVS